MPKSTEHHRDEWMEVSPIPTQFSQAYMAICNESGIAFLQIACEQEEEITMALPHLLTPECQEVIFGEPEQADAFQCLIPKECHFDEQFSTLFISIMYAYANTHQHDGKMLCT